jgi:hypothetical protein
MIPAVVNGIRVPSVIKRFTFNAFFDRQAVKDALSDMDFHALSRASLRVRRNAQRLIRKRGMARIPTRVATRFAGMGLPAMVQAGAITQRLADRVVREVQHPPASPPGSPPFTHTPFAGAPQSHVGFRRNLFNFYDHQTASAVVGPARRGRQLPYLHEFGGTVQLNTWVYNPQIPTRSGQMRSPIIWRMGAGARPTNANLWTQLPGSRSIAHYPARPFMAPALRLAIVNGDIARAFQSAFRPHARVGYGGRTITVRTF